MRHPIPSILFPALVAACAGPSTTGELAFTFEQGLADCVALSGDWNVEADPDRVDNRLLVQRASNERTVFNVLLFDRAHSQDLDLRVRLRALEGTVDQGGGLVWRARDLRNYYIARWNPLEDNLRVYTVVDGKRTQLASMDVEVDPRAWHELQVVMTGSKMACTLDGGMTLRVDDGTFAEAGMVGIWTKADARTAFDDLLLRAVAR